MTGAIGRVVVWLDAASDNRNAIDTAVRLAARAKTTVHGIFVEDEELLHLAALPFARQVTLGGVAEKLTTKEAELYLRAAAEQARKELAGAAKRHRVRSSFTVTRGRAGGELSAAAKGDLVVAGALTRPIAGHFRVECRWWSAAEIATGPLLLARHPWRPSGSVVMLLRDQGETSARLVEAAAQIAHAEESALIVISPAAVAGTPGFDKWIADRLAGSPVPVQIEVAPAEVAALQQRLGELDCRLLAIEAGLAESIANRLREIAERFACDILVVR